MSNAVTSPWKFPANIEPKHAAELRKRGISAEFAVASGVRSIADNEARSIGFEASIPVDQRKQGLQGICFCYRELVNGYEATWRLKPDSEFNLNGSQAKYLSRVADKVRAYFPHTTTPDHATDPTVNVIITEGEYKALAIAEKIIPIASRKTCVIGLQGVNGAWHRDKIIVVLPDGTKETRKEGHPHLIDDLQTWTWAKRVVYLTFDSDIASKKHAEEFKRNRRAGAMGAEHTLAQLLRAQNADVRIVVQPPKLDGTKYGADDYIAERGAHDFLQLLYNSWVVERNPDEVLYQQAAPAIRIESSSELIRTAPARPQMVIEKILPVGCVALLAAPAGIGKSLIAMNALQAVATGGRVLDFLSAERGRAALIQCEMPRWALAERVKGLGQIADDFMICTPGISLPLNYWEADGFAKRRETGYREHVMALLDQIRSQSISLACFDSLKDFTTLNMTDPDAAKHMMQIFRMIGAAARCGILLVHHHRKTGGRDSKYEGQDDMVGSFQLSAEADAVLSIYPQMRADGTARYKLVFSKVRHCAPIEPMEIERNCGGNSFAWRAIPWNDHTSGKVTDEDRLIGALESGPIAAGDAIKKSGLPKATFYRVYDRLEKKRIVTRNGNVYYLVDADEPLFHDGGN
jgi:hypothetical protein